jgi:hypothetical protein
MLHSGVERLRDQGGLKEGRKSSFAMYVLESQIGSCAGDGVMGTTLRLIALERLRTMSIDVLEGGGTFKWEEILVLRRVSRRKRVECLH